MSDPQPVRAQARRPQNAAAAAAAELELVRLYALRQEGAAALEPLFVAAPTGRGAPGRLEALRPARLVVVGEDVPRANADLVAAAHAGAPALQLYPTTMPPDRANALLQQQVRPRGWRGEGGACRAAGRGRRLVRSRPRACVNRLAGSARSPQGRFLPPPADGAAGGLPQWRELPEPEGGAGALLGDVEQDVSIAYKYG